MKISQRIRGWSLESFFKYHCQVLHGTQLAAVEGSPIP
jgi:hypothetical protein